MKNIYITLLVVIVTAGILFSSCSDYLKSDHLFKDRMTLEDVFSNKDYSDQWLARAYFFLGDGHLADVSSKGHIPFSFADDMYFGDRSDRYKEWKNGEYKEDGLGNLGANVWSKAYKGIRQSSIYIHNIDMNKDMTPEEIIDGKAQAHFLRAYYYWMMLRLFGPVPIIKSEGINYIDSYEDIAQSRSTYEECVDYIISELILAAKGLPEDRDLLSEARPTQGAALALRAKVLLFAASPLANGKGIEITNEIKDDQGKALFPATYDESKWAKAAAAAKDVMELSGKHDGSKYKLYTVPFKNSGIPSFPATIAPPADGEFSESDWPNGWKNIDPFESYRSVFNGAIHPFDNPEIVFTRGQNQSGEAIVVMVIHQLPRDAAGWNTHGLTLKQFDAYYMNDGTDAPGKDKEIGRGDGSNRVNGYVTKEDVDAGRYKPLLEGVSLQNANREPRFYASVAYSGSMWHLLFESEQKDREKQVFYYRGSGNGYTNTMFWLRTGIGVMKYVHPDDTFARARYKAEPAIRYAEILLTYAEALNELSGSYNIPSWDESKTHTIKRDVIEMKKGIHPVRIRAGVPDYSSGIYSSQDEFRKSLKRERQVELMGEGHRYFDLRRWMDAPVEESMPIYGYNALATKDQRDLFHTPIAVPSLPTTFSNKMWFWPISHDELRRNKRLTQNPGWTYAD